MYPSVSSGGTNPDRLIKTLARLRRAARLLPANDDLFAVSIELQQLIGPTVKRAVAARLLGVSQTALDRWVGSGDVAVVVSQQGRREVPLHALVDLILAVEERSSQGDEQYPLASILKERRIAAERLDLRKILPRGWGDESMTGHRGSELRSLAYHRAIAQKLDEQMLQDARERIGRWRVEGKIHPRYADRWESVLAWPVTRIARIISRDSEDAHDLRQNSPLAGALTEPERRRIFALVA